MSIYFTIKQLNSLFPVVYCAAIQSTDYYIVACFLWYCLYTLETFIDLDVKTENNFRLFAKLFSIITFDYRH